MIMDLCTRKKRNDLREMLYPHAEKETNGSLFLGTAAGCDDSWISFQGSCYLFGHEANTFIEANVCRFFK